jgi:hypothetical protein
VPNLVSNHLTTGLLSYIQTTGRYASGINLFEKLRSRDPEISSLLARVYIEADEEVRAVQLLHEAIQDLPMDCSTVRPSSATRRVAAILHLRSQREASSPLLANSAHGHVSQRFT